ncbi:MAG: hypothetical protein KF799_13475 [Bdellovibrionales bacterium]|nr:hypothetical protein [Bdellovibrionales bacterium]
MNLKRLSLGLIAGALCSSFTAQAEDSKTPSAPYIEPSRKCMAEGMINPPGKDYNYLYSKDCRVVYVLPPAKVKQSYRSEGNANIRLCKGVKSRMNALTTLENAHDALASQRRKWDERWQAATSTAQKTKIQAEIDHLTKQMAGYQEEISIGMKSLTDTYGNRPGATLSITMDSEISQSDLNELRAYNQANLRQTRTVVEKVVDAAGNPVLDENGRPKERTYDVTEISSLRKAPISKSIYSFVYYAPVNSEKDSGILSTSIPGLEVLQQEGAKTRTAHVRGGDVVTGEVLLSLIGICNSVIDQPDGKSVIDFKKAPIFVVNRNYEVQQMFAQGYVAELKIDNLIGQIVDQVTTNNNQGFTKSANFNHVINEKVDELVDFQWTTEYENPGNINLAQVLEIKKGVAALLIDDYFEKLEKLGILSKVSPSELPPAVGGNVTETRVANRCWTEKNGGISGFFGGRHSVCADYTYTVQVWHDGITTEKLSNLLRANIRSVDRMEVHQMAPFSFSTAFVD